jgi:hypothetical protein
VKKKVKPFFLLMHTWIEPLDDIVQRNNNYCCPRQGKDKVIVAITLNNKGERSSKMHMAIIRVIISCSCYIYGLECDKLLIHRRTW